MDDRVFLNTATFGVYAEVVRRRERLRPWLSKWPAAALALLLWLVRLRRLEVAAEFTGTDGVAFTENVKSDNMFS
mgnify:CR=1 FL=1